MYLPEKLNSWKYQTHSTEGHVAAGAGSTHLISWIHPSDNNLQPHGPKCIEFDMSASEGYLLKRNSKQEMKMSQLAAVTPILLESVISACSVICVYSKP